MRPAGILQNTATGRFHPIIFRPAPTPSESGLTSGPMRHKSAGHHTDGFATLEEAIADIEGKGLENCGAVWEWDGDGVPAMVQWFSTTGAA